MEAEANKVRFPNPRFANTKDPGSDFELQDNLLLVLGRISDLAAMLQCVSEDTPRSAIQNAGFMLMHEAKDGEMLLDVWYAHKAKPRLR